MRDVSLEDKYTLERGRVYLNGMQALTLLPMLQRRRDLAAGRNTAGFISGYRGSPLGGYDQALWQAQRHLARHHIVFQPGVNEELAATALWGTQQVGLAPGARYDGVFGLWYGKGPGVDRCGDVFKHANGAGSAPYGGVICIAGDDHAARSSTIAHQSEQAFIAAAMPVLAPAGIQDYLDLGLHGWALSRYSGCWVGFKAVADTIEASAVVDIDPARVSIVLPDDFALPADGLNIRWPDDRLAQEARLMETKLAAAQAYCRANALNRCVIDAPQARLGIVAAGKSYLDVREALALLGIDAPRAAALGLRVIKIGMVWPLDATDARRFAAGLETLLVVEEKRPLLESQLKEALYSLPQRPRILGKQDAHGMKLLPSSGELGPAQIAPIIARLLGEDAQVHERLARLQSVLERPSVSLPAKRLPWFCPGCPHNVSTRVPEGSRALAGIGCHFMVTWMNRATDTFAQMGGEGAAWIGQAPFTTTRHVFVNIGDGTWFHSGILALRAAVAAGVNVTYKILFNDAVAMTGGQPVDGRLSVPQLAQQLRAEGVGHIVIVTDGTPRSWRRSELPHGVLVRHRDEFDALQKEMRACPGVSALIYDQICAAEKRRRRKRGKLPDPPLRVFIHPDICEGCGDCSLQSNCLAVVPVETPLGTKRAIDQSACNKDFSCLKGFCPSFITIAGGSLRVAPAMTPDDTDAVLPTPTLAATQQPFNILITGVGGTGVVTLGALIGMAAHLDGKGVSVLDMTGIAQKGGSVFSHVRICDDPAALHAPRIPPGEVDALIGGDAIVSASAETLARLRAGRSRAVINATPTPTAEFTTQPDWRFPDAEIRSSLEATIGAAACSQLDAGTLATQLMGHTIYANTLLLGFAWQHGLIPVSAAALERAIEINGADVEMNLRAFRWGRRAAHDPDSIAALMPRRAAPQTESYTALLADRCARLTDYQDAALAERYRARVEEVRAHPAADEALAIAVARNYYKLLADKDAYEVARLYVETDFLERIAARFAGDWQLYFHLAPPLLARPDPNTGVIAKRRYGPWLMTPLRWLAKLRRLRGARWDPFARTPERRLAQRLLADYENDLTLILSRLDADKLPAALALANWPDAVRGFGHVREKSALAIRHVRDEARAKLAA